MKNIRVKITRDGSNAVRTLPMEEYLRGVVPSEGYASWPKEALTAQAIAARTYAYHKTAANAKKGFDVDDTAACQAYNPAKIDPRTDAVIKATSGQILTYAGKPLDTCVYCATNGGESVSSEARWGGARPYLPGKADPYDARVGKKRSGHGVGMSQWGACQMAKEGMGHKEILAFYYPGTTINKQEESQAMSIKTYSRSKDGASRLSANFAVSEFACKDGSDEILIADGLPPLLQAVRDKFGKPVIISSAYRTPAYNAKIGGAKGSQHMSGCAADIRIVGVKPRDLAVFAAAIPGVMGVGLYEYDGGKGAMTASGGPGFVHVDSGEGYAPHGVEPRNKKTLWFQDDPNGKERTVSSFGDTSGASAMPTLRRGSKGDAVKELQSLLHNNGCGPGPIDGVFGARTEESVKNYQRMKGRTIDGIVGPNTWADLKA